MTRYELNNSYFDWMYRLVCKSQRYLRLLRHLHGIDFDYILPMDGNRAEDGVNLRYRFGYENAYDEHAIASYLDDRPCSVLEMIVALAIRCEEHIMDDPDIGNRTGQWFWEMMHNLRLDNMTDDAYDGMRVETIVMRFLNREYGRNGEGGFTVKNSMRDMRSIEIWYQMCLYLDDIL